jgi:hypothetical protein
MPEDPLRTKLCDLLGIEFPIIAFTHCKDVAAITDPKGAVDSHRRGGLKQEMARAQHDAGVDVIIAQGYDAAGHTGAMGTFSIAPEVVSIAGDTPIIAAGGVTVYLRHDHAGARRGPRRPRVADRGAGVIMDLDAGRVVRARFCQP